MNWQKLLNSFILALGAIVVIAAAIGALMLLAGGIVWLFDISKYLGVGAIGFLFVAMITFSIYHAD